MDIGTLRGLGTLLVLLAFVGLALWVFSPRRQKDFDEASRLPFADEPESLDVQRRKPDA
ncbi:cbb3-type cytochrome c oxidase subunit 3 [Pseudomonas sp. DTU_2021_1001937_2_SI_NGA_ILE_001]|uniref:cbb3-type cytochrome oxidase subunit 3 n=1 Tax=Pseudomonas sp. DTU_2021_1001937_2_SI_NGA_ILE_001 TaxID=3077589 RepID=UPI0028FC3175|nr:cbb3-type cytochrome c oxidase subunit 3 [Pseudomonas sp. DTU_2021_1001937_2_SI_NGA_ILE_001]WNW10963.1 cbb3-type cytochrome c oxidase subunit 3 [Pseudomonas sp. DTU_2021_1001937_2_SI_NGA_ILE_001]